MKKIPFYNPCNNSNWKDAGNNPEVILLDEADALQFLKVSKRTLSNWRMKGILKFSKIGGKIYYRLSDFLEAYEKNMPGPATKPKL